MSVLRLRPGEKANDVVHSITTSTASVFSASMSGKLRDHDVFESRALMIRRIMDALADNSNSVVGVYGMGGFGKSTLLDQVKDILSEERSFDWVAKADVSKNPDVRTIQGEIAAGLSLTDIKNEETISGRAELLRNGLKAEEKDKKKVLVILDSLSEELDLKSVGIPCGPDNKATDASCC
ncbi:Acyl carrier protein [Psidium guajava]|nr:Acyl carrier protein [Psidium guajava]